MLCLTSTVTAGIRGRKLQVRKEVAQKAHTQQDKDTRSRRHCCVLHNYRRILAFWEEINQHVSSFLSEEEPWCLLYDCLCLRLVLPLLY